MMMPIHVYDFDGTIYNGDSTFDFYKYCIKRYPIILCTLPRVLLAFTFYIFNYYTKSQFKEVFYSFLRYIPNIDIELYLFWEVHRSKIKSWYLEQRSETDIIVSASPEFLLKPICHQLSIPYLIGSIVDSKTGIYSGLNCYGEEKVCRFYQHYPDYPITTFYSDSLSDHYLADIAQTAYIVMGNTLIPWAQYQESPFKKLKRTLLSGEFLLFLLIGCINAINGVLFSILFSQLFDPNSAFISGYLCSLLISYLLNSKITFRETLSFIKMIKFSISYIPNFIIQNIVVLIFYNFLRWDKLIAYLLAALIGVPITFLILKAYTFIKKN